MADRGIACVRFIGIEGNVRLDPNSLRSHADLERILSNYNFSLDGAVPSLRKRLSQHLDQLEAKVTKCVLQTDVLLSKPAALYMVSDDILLCVDDGHRAVYQIRLERDRVSIKGRSRKLVRYPEGVYRLESMTVSNAPDVYFTAAKSGQCNGGLHCFSIETGEVMTILENMTNSSKKIKKVAKFSDTIVLTDNEARQRNSRETDLLKNR